MRENANQKFNMIKVLGFLLFMSNFFYSFSQPINVLLRGARGDGLADDTYYIQKVLDEVDNCGGGTVLIPTGKSNYLISETLHIGSNTTLKFGNSFLKLVKYTTVGTMLINKKGATNIHIINPKIDGNNIFSGGTGENGISFGDGGVCTVKNGIIKNFKSGNIVHKMGGKGFQVEDKNVKLFRASGTKIINCTFALSSQFDIIENERYDSEIKLVYDSIYAENCDTFLLLQQVNGLKETSTKHNVTVSNFVVKNCGGGEGIFIFSRARGFKILNGTITGKRTRSIINGRHSEAIFKEISINQSADNIIDLRPSFYGYASTKAENNYYYLNILSPFGKLLTTSNSDQYSFRELFESKIIIYSPQIYSKSIILPQAIYKTSSLIYNQIGDSYIKVFKGDLLDLYNN